jgi:hypothetical protein
MEQQKALSQPKNAQQPETGGKKKLPALRDITKEQILLTGGALVLDGIADAAMHWDKTGVFLGLLATGVVARHSNDILDYFVPGRDSKRVVAMTERALDATTPAWRQHNNQAVGAKLRRLLFLDHRQEAPTGEDIPEPDSDETILVDEDDIMEELQPKPVDQPTANELVTSPDYSPVFPIYSNRVTLHLGQAIDRRALQVLTHAHAHRSTIQVPGRRFDPHFNQLIGKGWVAAANQGFGKSILNGVIIEQAGFCGLPVFVLDHKGEYGGVKTLSFMNTLLAGAEGNVDFILTEKNVDDFVQLVMTGRYQAIINLPSYGSAWIGKASIAAAIGKALMHYAESQWRAGLTLFPALIIMDEAQLYLPQDQSLLPPEATRNQNILADLKNAYFSLVSNGRSGGFTVGFATQSLTYLAKWAIKSSQIRIYGRHAEKNDLDACERTIDPAVATREEIESFPPGVGVVFGFTTKPMVVQFDRKQAQDLSQTPGIERLHAYSPQPSFSSSPYSEGEKLPTPPWPEEDGPRRTWKATTTPNPRLKRALAAYKPGMKWWDLANAAQLEPAEARELLRQIKARSVSAVSRSGNAGNAPETAAETAQQAAGKIITGRFGNESQSPVSGDPASRELDTTTVSMETRETIKRGRAKSPPMSHRDIAGLVGLTGRKYPIYQQVCREMGLMSATEAAE